MPRVQQLYVCLSSNEINFHRTTTDEINKESGPQWDLADIIGINDNLQNYSHVIFIEKKFDVIETSLLF